jgi:hypothetical protein
VERKPVNKFNAQNELYFECSTPNCWWTFQYAVRNPKRLPQEDKADYLAQRDESFKSHVCGKTPPK